MPRGPTSPNAERDVREAECRRDRRVRTCPFGDVQPGSEDRHAGEERRRNEDGHEPRGSLVRGPGEKPNDVVGEHGKDEHGDEGTGAEQAEDLRELAPRLVVSMAGEHERHQRALESEQDERDDDREPGCDSVDPDVGEAEPRPDRDPVGVEVEEVPALPGISGRSRRASPGASPGRTGGPTALGRARRRSPHRSCRRSAGR